MLPNLEDCPNLVFEGILAFLTLNDLRSLRLCNRTLAAKTTQGHFKSYFHTKHIDITSNSLKEFIDATQPGELGCLIQNLVLVGIVNNPMFFEYFLREGYKYSFEADSDDNSKDAFEEYSKLNPKAKAERAKAKKAKARRNIEILRQRQAEYEELHRSGMDASLLSKAFKNIISNSKTGKLISISLEVAVYCRNAEQRSSPLAGGEWRLIWRSAANTFHTVIHSLALSGLQVKRFNIFNDRQLQRCSLACGELSRIDFTHPGISSCLGSLKSLSISLSDEVSFDSRVGGEQSQDLIEEQPLDLPPRTDEGMPTETALEGSSFGFTKLLTFCGQIEDLEIHQYRSRAVAPSLRKILPDIAELETPLKLKRLELRGLYVNDDVLLAVIQRTGIRKLSMYTVSIVSGSFRSVFDYCTSDIAGMEELHFEGLKEASAQVFFQGPEVSSFAPETTDPGSNLLKRKCGEVRKRITYQTLDGSRRLMRWRTQLRREYGPPNEELVNSPHRRISSFR